MLLCSDPDVAFDKFELPEVTITSVAVEIVVTVEELATAPVLVLTVSVLESVVSGVASLVSVV